MWTSLSCAHDNDVLESTAFGQRHVALGFSGGAPRASRRRR
jgi:hypothetical protein